MGRLFELPEILGQAGDGRGRVEDDLRAVQAERARTFREVPVVADVDADLRERRVEDRVAEIAGPEVELLPESWLAVRDVRLAVLAEVGPVGVDHRRSVVVDARLLFLVDRRDDHHPMLLRQLAHERNRRPVGHALGQVVPAGFLLGAEVGAVEELLQAQDLHLLARRLADERHVAVDHRLLDRGEIPLGSEHVPRLDESAAHRPGHTKRLLVRPCRSPSMPRRNPVAARSVETADPRAAAAGGGFNQRGERFFRAGLPLPGVPEPDRPRDSIEHRPVLLRLGIRNDGRDVEQIAVGEKRRVEADAVLSRQGMKLLTSDTPRPLRCDSRMSRGSDV